MTLRKVQVGILLALMAVAACGTKGRALIPADVTVASDLPGVATVKVVVTQDGVEVASQIFNVTGSGSAPLEVGVYVPAGVEGDVEVHVIAYDKDGNRIGESPVIHVRVVAGQQT